MRPLITKKFFDRLAGHQTNYGKETTNCDLNVSRRVSQATCYPSWQPLTLTTIPNREPILDTLSLVCAIEEETLMPRAIRIEASN
jgi:hypothetical protein